MPRLAPVLLLLSALGTALFPSEARAASVAELASQLKASDDFRVRTQAALALGASGEEAAVKPLCDALGDSNASVKVAAAAALGKLGKPSGVPCLKAALAKETTPSVKAQEEKSIAALDKAGSAGSAPSGPAAPPPPGPDTKYYVAIRDHQQDEPPRRGGRRHRARRDAGEAPREEGLRSRAQGGDARAGRADREVEEAQGLLPHRHGRAAGLRRR
ncbi:MAG: HEAT repeat domain-containing protein [Minicystis sp.]